jgi:hypothetical protein
MKDDQIVNRAFEKMDDTMKTCLRFSYRDPLYSSEINTSLEEFINGRQWRVNTAGCVLYGFTCKQSDIKQLRQVVELLEHYTDYLKYKKEIEKIQWIEQTESRQSHRDLNGY